MFSFVFDGRRVVWTGGEKTLQLGMSTVFARVVEEVESLESGITLHPEVGTEKKLLLNWIKQFWSQCVYEDKDMSLCNIGHAMTIRFNKTLLIQYDPLSLALYQRYLLI